MELSPPSDMFPQQRVQLRAAGGDRDAVRGEQKHSQMVLLSNSGVKIGLKNMSVVKAHKGKQDRNKKHKSIQHNNYNSYRVLIFFKNIFTVFLFSPVKKKRGFFIHVYSEGMLAGKTRKREKGRGGGSSPWSAVVEK